jgi:hypothetical protein
MRPLFTIHAGEYVAGSFIEKTFRNCRVWIPSRDTGIDLLVTNAACSRSLKLQVKFSKDFAPTDASREYQNKLLACSWFKIPTDALRRSEADYWVLVLHSFKEGRPRFLVIKPSELLKRASKYHGRRNRYDFYFWINSSNRCWDAREFGAEDRRKIAHNCLVNAERNYSRFLDNWKPLEQLNRKRR